MCLLHRVLGPLVSTLSPQGAGLDECLHVLAALRFARARTETRGRGPTERLRPCLTGPAERSSLRVLGGIFDRCANCRARGGVANSKIGTCRGRSAGGSYPMGFEMKRTRR